MNISKIHNYMQGKKLRRIVFLTATKFQKSLKLVRFGSFKNIFTNISEIKAERRYDYTSRKKILRVTFLKTYRKIIEVGKANYIITNFSCCIFSIIFPQLSVTRHPLVQRFQRFHLVTVFILFIALDRRYTYLEFL